MIVTSPRAFCTPVNACWQRALQDELQSEAFQNLENFVSAQRGGEVPVFPRADRVFHAIDRVALDQVKVVIIGQDPYHGPGQAEGLSFSVPRGIPIPPSLRNIFQELESDLEIPPSTHGHLGEWADQGVLLLNATLTVRQGEAASHFGYGWERITDQIVAAVAARKTAVVFMLWGRFAKDKVERALPPLAENQLVLTAPHPSPLSAHRGFFGCRHFSKCNAFLERHGLSPINW